MDFSSSDLVSFEILMCVMELLSYLNKCLGSDVLTYDNTCIVCGAGISKDSGLPLGGDIVRRVYSDFSLGEELIPFFEQYNDSVISMLYHTPTSFFSQPRLEVLFDGIRKVLSDSEYSDYIFDVFFRGVCCDEEEGSLRSFRVNPNYNHFLIAEYIFHGGTCLTFNFDELIECAYRDLYGQELATVSFPMVSDPFHGSIPGLVKIHGTFLSKKNSTDNIGIDIRNIQINGFSDRESVFLSEIMRGKCNLIFYGYSISDTLDFIPFLNASFRGRSISAFFLNFDQSVLTPRCRFVDLSCQASGYFQVDYYLGRVIDRFCFIDYNPDCSLKDLMELPSNLSDLIYVVDDGILSKVKTNRCSFVKLSVFKTLGILNRFGGKELKELACLKEGDEGYTLYQDFDFCWRNVRGLYESNLRGALGRFLKVRSLQSYNNLFGVLNEYLFLDNAKGIFSVLFCSFMLIVMWISLVLIYWGIDGATINELAVGRNLYMPFFRVLKGLRIRGVAAPFFGRGLIRYIDRVRQKSIDLGDFNLYRFIEKERIKVIYYSKGDTDTVLRDLDELITKNVDTNYFVDIANLLRFKYEITKKETDREVCEIFTSLTNDSLNKRKLKSTRDLFCNLDQSPLR